MTPIISLLALLISSLMLSSVTAAKTSKSINVRILYPEPIPATYRGDINGSKSKVENSLKGISATLTRRQLRSVENHQRELQLTTCKLCASRPPFMCTDYYGGSKGSCRRHLEGQTEIADDELESDFGRHLLISDKDCIKALDAIQKILKVELSKDGLEWVNANGTFECIEFLE